MQKVVGSSPIIRLTGNPRHGGGSVILGALPERNQQRGECPPQRVGRVNRSGSGSISLSLSPTHSVRPLHRRGERSGRGPLAPIW